MRAAFILLLVLSTLVACGNIGNVSADPIIFVPYVEELSFPAEVEAGEWMEIKVSLDFGSRSALLDSGDYIVTSNLIGEDFTVYMVEGGPSDQDLAAVSGSFRSSNSVQETLRFFVHLPGEYQLRLGSVNHPQQAGAKLHYGWGDHSLPRNNTFGYRRIDFTAR
ncbi:hypothetical protein IT575_15125 [bacterium]|nr:hypothetical protein [bacterium]